MSASAIRRKSYKKAQGEAVPFSPVAWDEADGGQVHAGKLQVMEKFFTPLQHPKDGKGSGRELSRCRQQWTEACVDSFSSPSSSSAASSTSAASWASEASLEEAFLEGGPMAQPQHSHSCIDISREARAFRRVREGTGNYQAKEPVSFPRLKKGHSKSVDRLPQQRGPQEAQSPPLAQPGGESRLYKASSLERSLVINEQAEILAPRLHRRAGAPLPSKGILKNRAIAKGDGLRKAKSIETITVQAGGREPQAPPPSRSEDELEPPLAGLGLGGTKKHQSMDQMKLVEEKLRFSEFLNEITRQVMSPSSLSSLGWRPPEASSAGKGSGTDSSESKSSGSKASSPGSPTESREGQHQQERALPVKRRDPRGDHTNPVASRHMGDISSLELGAEPQSRLGGDVQRRPREDRPGHEETEGHEQPLAPKKVEKDRVSPPKELWGKEQPEGTTRKGGAHCKELQLQMVNTDPVKLPRDCDVEHTGGTGAGAKSGPAGQQDLHHTWEELELLKEKFHRLQEDYSSTQRTNQLLEEKLHLIAQSMAAERQTLNQRITELLERLVSAQNTICTLERLNISALLSESSGKHHHMEKADSADSLYSLHISDVAPPAAFMDSASDTHTTTPSQSDSATEANKPGCSSESDTATPKGDRPQARDYHSLPPPAQLESHKRTTAFMPWKQQQQPGELLEHVNSTESECSVEEGAQIHTLPMPRFLYLRQEALVAPSVPALPPTDDLCPPSSQGLLLGGQLELVPELSSTDSSDGDEAWSQSPAEKEPRVALDYQAAQKLLDSLLKKEHFLKKEPAIASGGVYQERSETCQAKGQQRRIRYYWDFQNPGEKQPLLHQPLLHQPQHRGESLSRDKGKVVLEGEQECGDEMMDSTLL